MLVSKIVLEKDISKIKNLKVQKPKYEGCQFVNRLNASVYTVLSTDENDKTLEDVKAKNIEVSSTIPYKVLGFELEDGSFISIKDITENEKIELSSGPIPIIRPDKMREIIVDKYRDSGVIIFATEMDETCLTETEVPSNKKLKVRFKDSTCYINIPAIVLAPRLKYKSKYFSDKEYLEIVTNILKSNEDALIVSQEIIKSISNILDREVI